MSFTPDPVQAAEAEVALAEEHLNEALHGVASAPQATTSPPLVEAAAGAGEPPPSLTVPQAGDVTLSSANPFRSFRASDGTVVTFDGVKVSATIAPMIEKEAADSGFPLRKA